jgi:ABC-type branched-subunit amino acid transport system substrate-binding protein
LGAGIWDDNTIKQNPLMRGAIYAAPSAKTRRNFEQQYQAVYNQSPKRLASLGYDATALAIVLLRQSHGKISRASLTNPNGFNGVDGVFRFTQNGMTERGIAINKIGARGQSGIVEAAPSGFNTRISSR